VELLAAAEVKMLVDVRTVPRSRTNPQFNGETLPAALEDFGIGYRHLASLGGLRGRRKDGKESPNDFWENASFRNYADYAETEEFRAGLESLRSMGQLQVCAIMCAEAVWWRCHRRIIADYLLAAGETVFHILSPKKVEPARLTASARPNPDGTLVYPKEEDISTRS
jgi:uncharacterized protein (DUF488 family)